MIQLSRAKDGGKDEGMEGWAEARFMGNGLKDGQEGNGTTGGGSKPLPCPSVPTSASGDMDNITGEFALIISGHSLVRITHHDTLKSDLNTRHIFAVICITFCIFNCDHFHKLLISSCTLTGTCT